MTTQTGRAAGVDAVALAMGVGFAVIWSSAFTSAKIALADAPPFLMLAARFTLSGVAAVLIALALGQRLPRDRRVWMAVALFGLCQNTLYLGLNFWAMTRVPAGLAAIIASALPLSVALLSWLVFRERLAALGVAGLVVGLSGVALIMGGRVAGGADALGVGLCVVGLLALTVATLTLRGMAGGVGVLMAVGLQMLVGAAALWPIGLALENPAAVNPTLSLALAFAYTTVFPGLVATVIWFRLVARIGATAASAFHFLNPALGVGIAAALLGETVDWVDGAGVALITAAILMVQRARG
jgi:drug/metabolite transporter (DMT)-like permease